MAKDQLVARRRSVLNWVHRNRPRFRPSADRGPLYRPIMVLDVAAFGYLDNRTQLSVRTALYAAVRGAFRGTGIRWSALAVEDRGDGAIILAPPLVSKVDLLDPVIPNLAARLREHNAAAEPGQRIRLRVSVHAGEVHRDRAGWVGTDLNVACRLVSNPAVSRYLRQRPDADLLVVVSDSLYDAIVRHKYRRIDPTTYQAVEIEIKEFHARAWLHMPS